jgi:ATP-dependent Lhr-like helicase
MARNAAWVQINQYMYQDDQPPADTASSLRGDLLQQLVFDPGLRPTIKNEIVRQFEEKRQRLSPGYAPAGSRDLLDWVKERVAIPYPEWQKLLQAIANHHGMDPAGMLTPVADKLVRIEPTRGSTPLVAALEDAPRLSHGLYAGLSRLKVGRLDTGEDIPVSELEALLPSDLQPEETQAALIGQWLQFYGPVTVGFVSTAFGIALPDIQPILSDLIDARTLVSGRLIEPGETEEICDSQNFELLLRLARKAAVPDFSPLNFEMLQLLLARIQGMTQKTDGVDALGQCIERLVCLPVSAATWEADIIPARVDGYDPSWLDTLTQESDLMWLGEKGQKVAFCFQSDLDLYKANDEGVSSSQRAASHSNNVNETAAATNELPDIDSDLQNLMPDPQGRYDFGAFLQKSDYNATQLSERLWEAVWSGQITNDTFGALRRGIEHRFKAPELTQFRSRSAPARRRGRVGIGSRRWKNSLPYAGYWHQIPLPEAVEDLIEIEEHKKDRVRILLERYGILFRELLYREKPGWRWADIFRTLRLMELSGELLAGYFFHGIPGPQFMSHQAFRLLTHGLPEDAVYWLNAADPTSLCGTSLTAVKDWLPKRLAGTHLVFHGPKLVIVSRRHARQMTVNVESNDSRLSEYFAFLQHLLLRRSQPLRQITIETINEIEAAQSAYVDALRTAFDVIIDYKQIILYRRES